MKSKLDELLLKKRKLWVKNLFIIIFVCLFVFFLYWVIFERRYEHTDDAYVQGNIIHVSAQISAPVKEIYAINADSVKQGDLLVRLDDTEALVEVERARGALGSAVRQAVQLFLQVDRAKSNLAMQEAKLHQANLDYIHRKNLSAVKAISLEEEENARTNFQIAQNSTNIARNQLEEALSQVQGTSVVDHPLVVQAKSNFCQAYLNLMHTKIYSPVEGVIAERSVQVGDLVGPGRSLMSVVPLSEIWVTANFKETQLKGIKPGQPVKLKSDLYGRSVVFKGKVHGLVPGTGSSFSLLPAMNATGNWIKIIQRVPVIIKLEKDNLDKYPLLVGLSMDVSVKKIDVEEGTQTEEEPKALFETSIYDNQIHQINQIIEQIIQQNLGEGVAKLTVPLAREIGKNFANREESIAETIDDERDAKDLLICEARGIGSFAIPSGY